MITTNIQGLINEIKNLRDKDFELDSEEIKYKIYYLYGNIIDTLENIEEIHLKDFYNHF